MEPGYRFDFVNRDGTVDTFDLAPASDDADAARKARSAMLVSLTAVAVEVWKDGARLCRIRRDAGPLPAPAPADPVQAPALQALAGARVEAPAPLAAPIFVPRADDGCRPAAAAASA